MQLRLLFITLACFIAFDTFGQYTIVTDPSNEQVDCQYDVDPLDHPDYLAWLNNNGGGAATVDCGSDVVWTVNDVDFDYNNGCQDGIIHIEWQLTADCTTDVGWANGTFFIETDYPTFDVDDLTLDCGASNNDVLISVWINAVSNSITDDCTPNSDFTVEHSYSGVAPECGDSDYIYFELIDNCVGYEVDAESGFIFVQKSKLSFSDNDYSESEGSTSIEFCLVVEDANLDAPVDVEITFSEPSSGAATNGVDYGPVNTVETYTIPAGPPATHCFTINLIDDILAEPTEYVEMDITNIISSLDEVELDYPSNTQLRINDDDDDDNDGIENSIDNCPSDSNNLQEDIDGDGIGDVCDSQNVVSKLHTVEDNIFLDKVASGVITRSPDGNCWMMYVANNGDVRTISVVCPN